MLAVAACLLGLFSILVIAELFAKYKVLKGEYLRKFVHITSGCFIAGWPWLVSWQSIRLLALAMIIVIIANHYLSFFSYHNHRASLGDIFLALAVLVSASLTDNKVFFCLAILEVALADGLAAVVGIGFGKKWTYKVFGHKKTLVGSMVFWVVSICILAVGLLSQADIISFQAYSLIIIFAPPALTVVENLSIFGLDNLVLPLATIALLRIVQS